MKLSPKQKEVIQKMRDGIELTKTGLEQKFQIGNEGLKGTTVYSLANHLLVKHSHGRYPIKYYTLTDLGKTIQL